MQKKGANISLKGYDDIFSTDQSRAEAQQERVQEIPLSELHPFEGHPFRVVDDEEMMKTAESVRDFGVLTPAIVRPDPDGGYEIVSGHRRHRASELAGKETMPAIVRDLDDDAAIILMVDANLQRESILPSERAFAYKMKLDAINHQGQRTDLTSSQVGMKLQAMDIVGQEAGESRNQVHRYIRLTELIPELLDMVDTGQIKFNPAVERSYLASEEQKDFLSAMDYAQAAPSLSQAQRIKKLAQEGECTLDAMCEIMNEIKKGELDRVTFKTDSLRKYFPKSYTNKQMEDKIIQLLEQWQKKREKSMKKARDPAVHGKQSVKQLLGQNQGATNVEIDKESIRDFEKLAKKYGVDFAVRKDKSVDPPRFLVFVRSKDADALDAICKEHQARALTKNEKPSVLAQLKKFKEIVAAIPKKVREKKQERDL